MAYADELLKDAFHLADFVSNWKRPDQRVPLGRMFTHKNMVEAKFQKPGTDAAVDGELKTVIAAFAQLQKDRQIADYNVGRNWSPLDVKNTLQLAEGAFKSWHSIRDEKIAQDHLLRMFGARRFD